MTGSTTSSRRAGRLLEWWKQRWVAIGFIVVLAASALVIWNLAGGLPSNRECRTDEREKAAAAGSVPVPADNPQVSRTLEIVDTKETRVRLGRDFNPARTAIALRTDPLPTPAPEFAAVRLKVQSFRRGESGDVRQAVFAHGVFDSPQTVVIFLCVAREGRPGEGYDGFALDAGEYTGTLSLTDPRLPNTSVSFSVALAYPNQFYPLLPLVGIVFVGTLYLMILRRSDADFDEAVGLQDLHNFLRRPSGAAAVAAGTVGAVTVYMTTYINSDVWGTGIDSFLLVGSMFGAFVSTGTAFRFASNLGRSRGTQRAVTS